MHYLDPVFSDFELCVIFNHLATLTSKNKFFNDFFSLSSDWKSRKTFVCTCKSVKKKLYISIIKI